MTEERPPFPVLDPMTQDEINQLVMEMYKLEHEEKVKSERLAGIVAAAEGEGFAVVKPKSPFQSITVMGVGITAVGQTLGATLNELLLSFGIRVSPNVDLEAGVGTLFTLIGLVVTLIGALRRRDISWSE